MGKSNNGSKGPGYDYWSRRNYKGMDRPGKLSKKITNKADRRKTKNKLEGEKNEDTDICEES